MTQVLANMRVMITRSSSGNAAWRSKLEDAGARVYELPTFRTVARRGALDPFLDKLPQYDWLVFTSAAGVRYFREAVASLRYQLKDIPKIAVVGPETVAAAHTAGLIATFIPSHADSESLAAELPRVNNSPILILQAQMAGQTLANRLQQRGAKVTMAVLYDTQILDDPDDEAAALLMTGVIEAIVFASPSAVQGFSQRLDNRVFKQACAIPAVALGNRTAIVLKEAGFHRISITSKANIQGVIMSLTHLQSR